VTSTHPVPRASRNPAHGADATLTRWARLSLARRRRVPRWGSVAEPGTGGVAVSTAPGRGAVVAVSTAPGSGAVVAGGLVFLLARPWLGGLPLAVPLLACGYVALLAGALAVRVQTAGAPLGWGVPLLLGLVGVVAASVAGGPVADRRVGVVAGGLAVVAALAEEALFRRVLYDRLLRFGIVAAVGGSAVVFALVHLPAYGLAAMPVDLGAALLLSWQRYASGRWTVPAVTHVVANLLAVT
jgi:membrane protease YdiL (CAAX protease family)